MKKSKAFLLDTDIVIYWLRNKYPRIDKKIKKINEKRIFISSITVAELYFGAYNSTRKDENKLLIDELLEKINIIYFDENAADCFGEIKSLSKTQGKIIGDSDLFIAASAISNNLVLVTNNERHFDRIENLKVENWIR
jgi:tRNA(fMet)-specific endonuclease VapC